MNFREVEHKTVLIRDQDLISEYLEGRETKANVLVCRAYVDHEAGLSYQVLSLGLLEDGDFTLIKGREGQLFKLRAEAVEDDRIMILRKDPVSEIFKEQIAMTEEYYYYNPDVLVAREKTNVDHLRHPYYPDDVLCLLLHDDEKYEQVWVRLESVAQYEKSPTDTNEYFCGTLLNTPVLPDCILTAGSSVYVIAKDTPNGTIAFIMPMVM